MPEVWTGEVKKRMHLAQIKTSELAKESGYSAGYLSMVMTGEKKKGTEETRTRILDALTRLEEKRKNENGGP